MSETNERSVGSAGSGAERPLGDPEIAVEILRLRVTELEEAIRRLADQDATLSVCDGNVTVTMDARLSPVDVLAVEWAAAIARKQCQVAVHKTLRRLLERLG